VSAASCGRAIGARLPYGNRRDRRTARGRASLAGIRSPACAERLSGARSLREMVFAHVRTQTRDDYAASAAQTTISAPSGPTSHLALSPGGALRQMRSRPLRFEMGSGEALDIVAREAASRLWRRDRCWHDVRLSAGVPAGARAPVLPTRFGFADGCVCMTSFRGAELTVRAVARGAVCAMSVTTRASAQHASTVPHALRRG